MKKRLIFINTHESRAMVLIEVVIAILILVALAVPVFQMFSQSNRMFEIGKKRSLANLLAHKVIEDLMALSYQGKLYKIPQHSEYRAVVKVNGVILSPYFEKMDGKLEALSELDYPNMVRELKDFRCRVILQPALDLKDSKNFQIAQVEVKFPNRSGKNDSVIMQIILSTLAQIR